jgi:hypothetical protein
LRYENGVLQPTTHLNNIKSQQLKIHSSQEN